MRDAVFAAVQQRTVRRVALQTFQHLHRLSLRFHLDRQTGGLSRAIERGTTGIEQVLRLAVFNIVPTLFEVALVVVILWSVFDWRFAAAHAGRGRRVHRLHARLHQLAGALSPDDERDRQRGAVARPSTAC